MIRIRLRRIGKKHHPYYRVVVADKPDKRDGAFLETLGSYDPHANPPSAVLDEAKIREWLGKGAQPSEAAEKILRRAGILASPAKVAAVAVAEPPAKAKKGTKKAAAAATKAPAAPKAAAAETPAEATPEPGAEAVQAPAEANEEPAAAETE